jgi:hypothetical protein
MQTTINQIKRTFKTININDTERIMLYRYKYNEFYNSNYNIYSSKLINILKSNKAIYLNLLISLKREHNQKENIGQLINYNSYIDVINSINIENKKIKELLINDLQQKFIFNINCINKLHSIEQKVIYLNELIKTESKRIKNLIKNIDIKQKPCLIYDYNQSKNRIITDKAKSIITYFMLNRIKNRSYYLFYTEDDLINKARITAFNDAISDLKLNSIIEQKTL